MSQVVLVVPTDLVTTPSIVDGVTMITPTKITEGGRVGPQGVKGDKGDPGDPGSAGERGDTLTTIAAETLSGHRAVLITTANEAAYISNSDPTHSYRFTGITLGAAIIGTPVTIQLFGSITEPSWNWTLNQPIYLGVDGVLTQTVPTQPVSQFVMVVGFPITAHTMFISPQSAISIL